LHSANRALNKGYNKELFSFVRFQANEQLIVVSNFSATDQQQFELNIPAKIISELKLKAGHYQLNDALSQQQNHLTVEHGKGQLSMSLAPLQSVAYRIDKL
jgi:hypothetical protein